METLVLFKQIATYICVQRCYSVNIDKPMLCTPWPIIIL